MVYMDLKELLGEELYKQVTAKVGDSKIDIVSDGKWIPKDKFDKVNGDKKELQTQVDSLKDISTKYEALQGDVAKWKDEAATVPALQKKMKEWEEESTDLQAKLKANDEQIKTFDEKEQQYQQQLKETKITGEIEKSLAGAKYPELLMSKIDKSKIELAEDGSVKGIKEQLDTLKETYKDFFGEVKHAGHPPNPGASPSPVDGAKKKLQELADKARLSGKIEDRVEYAAAQAEYAKQKQI